MAQPTASATINFSGAESGESSGGFPVALDSDRNEGKTTFAPGESVYIKITPTGEYSIASSAGTVSSDGKNIPSPFTENLEFANSKTATLSYPNSGGVSYRWLGKSGGTPLFNGQAVTLPADTVGVLEVTYDTFSDRLRLDVTTADMGGNDELPVLVAVTDAEGTTNSLTVTFTTDGDVPGVPVPVEIEVTNFCSGAVVAGASVYVDGAFIGTSSAAGIVYAGMLVPGQTYTLRITAPEFKDSDKDILYNDSFVVPTS